MRERLKKLVRPFLRVPVLGRLLRMLLAVWRGPVIAARLNQVEDSLRRYEADRGQLEADRAQLEADRAQLAGALDSVLDNMTQVASRQREIDADRENLVRSVPVALRRLRRAQACVDERFGEVEGQVAEIAGQLGQVAEIAARLGQVAEIAARLDQVAEIAGRLDQTAPQDAELKLKDLSRSVGWLHERVEFIRSELLFELRYRHGGQGEPAEPVEAKVKIDLSARTEPLRINLGCGHVPLPGYVNVDNRDLPSVDVVADVYALPFEDGTVAEFFSSHFLEHFPLEEFRRRLLPFLRSKLAPGGTLRAVVPDVDAMMRAYVSGNYPYEHMREVVYGGQDYDGDFHYNMFTPSSLTQLLTGGGFSAVKVVEAGRVNGKSLEFEIEATRG